MRHIRTGPLIMICFIFGILFMPQMALGQKLKVTDSSGVLHSLLCSEMVDVQVICQLTDKQNQNQVFIERTGFLERTRSAREKCSSKARTRSYRYAANLLLASLWSTRIRKARSGFIRTRRYYKDYGQFAFKLQGKRNDLWTPWAKTWLMNGRFAFKSLPRRVWIFESSQKSRA